MTFDVTALLGKLFGGGPTIAPAPTVAEAAPVPETVPQPEAAADPPAATWFAGWVRRPDFHGCAGSEAPDLPERQRWWARCDFSDLPESPGDLRDVRLPWLFQTPA
jgi:hypothetical protein